MPRVPNNNLPNEPLHRIPKVPEEFDLPQRTTRNVEHLRKVRNKLKSKQLIEDEKRRIGKEEYQRKLSLRLRNII